MTQFCGDDGTQPIGTICDVLTKHGVKNSYDSGRDNFTVYFGDKPEIIKVSGGYLTRKIIHRLSEKLRIPIADFYHTGGLVN